MNAFLARIRTRATSHSSAGTSSSHTTTASPSAQTEQTSPALRHDTPSPARSHESPAIERRIHPDLNALVQELAAAEERPSSSGPAGRRPSLPDWIPEPRQPLAPLTPPQSLHIATGASIQPGSTTQPHPPGPSRRLFGLAGPRQWSTFGRSRDASTSAVPLSAVEDAPPSAWRAVTGRRQRSGPSSRASSASPPGSVPPSRRSSLKENASARSVPSGRATGSQAPPSRPHTAPSSSQSQSHSSAHTPHGRAQTPTSTHTFGAEPHVPPAPGASTSRPTTQSSRVTNSSAGRRSSTGSSGQQKRSGPTPREPRTERVSEATLGDARLVQSPEPVDGAAAAPLSVEAQGPASAGAPLPRADNVPDLPPSTPTATGLPFPIPPSPLRPATTSLQDDTHDGPPNNLSPGPSDHLQHDAPTTDEPTMSRATPTPAPDTPTPAPRAERKDSGPPSGLAPRARRTSSSASRGKTKSALAPRARSPRQLSFPRAPAYATPQTSAHSASDAAAGAGPSTPPPRPQKESANGDGARRESRSASEPSAPPMHARTTSKGKRKAEDDVERTPPDNRGSVRTTTFAEADSRGQRISDTSRAPSSYNRKRARTSGPLPPTAASPPASPAASRKESPGSWSRRSARPAASVRSASASITQGASHPHHASGSHAHAHSASASTSAPQAGSSTAPHPAHRRLSTSARSIPLSAIVAPHAPSLSLAPSSVYHMRDPRRPRPQPTPWALRRRGAGADEPGSPPHAWLFFVGFVLFPLWWLAAVWRVPRTRVVGGTDTEKAVVVDDPQIEHDARAWRFRCRVMSVVALFTYIPFIILVAIFAPR